MRAAQFNEKALSELNDWFTRDRKTGLRILRMIRECCKMPFEGIGKPEPLKGTKNSLWSRRIDDKNRMVYRVNDEAIIVYALRGHYDD